LLKDKISVDLYNQVDGVLKTMGYSLNPETKAMPWLISSQISNLKATKNGFDSSLGIDNYFINKAKDIKPIVELESADFQYKMLSNLKDTFQEALLRGSLSSNEEYKASIDNLYKYWRTGDIKTMDEILFPKDSLNAETEEFNDIICYQRNIGMEMKIEEYLKDETKTYFVVAGAAHMVGPKGVVSLLIANGYKVKQM